MTELKVRDRGYVRGRYRYACTAPLGAFRVGDTLSTEFGPRRCFEIGPHSWTDRVSGEAVATYYIEHTDPAERLTIEQSTRILRQVRRQKQARKLQQEMAEIPLLAKSTTALERQVAAWKILGKLEK